MYWGYIGIIGYSEERNILEVYTYNGKENGSYYRINWGYLSIMEKNMEAATEFVGVIYRYNGKENGNRPLMQSLLNVRCPRFSGAHCALASRSAVVHLSCSLNSLNKGGSSCRGLYRARGVL